MAKATTIKRATARPGSSGPFKLRKSGESEADVKDLVHVMRHGVRCDTERRGHASPQGRSPLEIVVDASEGFIPLWAKNTTLRWRFRESSMKAFEDPAAAKTAIEELLGKAILEWKDAAPVKFVRNNDLWDFEIVMRHADDCDVSGCVLASAFFPDAGRHKLVLFPKLFEQVQREQLDTLAHEIGHIFGLRHFFAQISETQWPSKIFGKHRKFTIMNYGADSRLTSADRTDLKKLYQAAWAGQLTQINGTPINFVKPYHASGDLAEDMVGVESVQRIAPFSRRPSRG